jgi:FkbM family methyltransferase
MGLMFSRYLRAGLRAYIRHSPLERGKTRLMEALAAACADREPQRVVLPGGALMDVDLREHVQRWIYYFGAYERDTLVWFQGMLRPGMTVFDIGAHVGQYTVAAARAVGPTGHVHAFEPHAANFGRLKANVTINGFANVAANHQAVSDSTGETILFAPRSDNSGECALFPCYTGMGEECVSTVALDDYVRHADLGPSGRIDVLKVDVQGAEERVFRGARQVLLVHRPVVVCEFEERWLHGMGSSTVRLKALLADAGYRAHRIEGRELVPVSPDEVHSFANLALLPEQRTPAP